MLYHDKTQYLSDTIAVLVSSPRASSSTPTVLWPPEHHGCSALPASSDLSAMFHLDGMHFFCKLFLLLLSLDGLHITFLLERTELHSLCMVTTWVPPRPYRHSSSWNSRRSRVYPSLVKPANARKWGEEEGAATGVAMARALDVRVRPARIPGWHGDVLGNLCYVWIDRAYRLR
jgi:hypothetical protein